MGERGPAPKRSGVRRRQTTAQKTPKPKTAAAKAPKAGTKTYGDPLTGRHSATARRFWEQLRRSQQAEFFEPSDWAAAELVVAAIDEFVRSPTAAMLSAIRSSMASLLVTEGDRRRVGLELERKKPEADGEAEVTALDDYRRRLAG